MLVKFIDFFPLGKISLAQLIIAMPFTNTLVKVTITGKSLLEAFENSVNMFRKTHGSYLFLQVSGKSFVLKLM